VKVAKIGFAEGTCSNCGRTYQQKRPATTVVCDCYKYCPICQPSFTVKMEPYIPELTPSTYGAIESDKAIGDTESPLKTLFRCPKCGYYSAQKPVEVTLS